MFACVSPKLTPKKKVQKFYASRVRKEQRKGPGTSREMPDHVIGLQKQTIQRWKQNVRKKVRNVIRFGTEQNLYLVSHRAQPFQRNSVTNVSSDTTRTHNSICTWKNICYDTIRHLHLEMSSMIQRDFPCTHSSCPITWF